MKAHKSISSVLIIFIVSLGFFITENALALNYVVKRGDTLSKIAVKYNTTINIIMNVNGLRSNLIIVGQTLEIPEAGDITIYKAPADTPVEPPVKAKEDSSKEPSAIVEDIEEMTEPPIRPEAPSEKTSTVIEDQPQIPGAIDFKWAFVARKDPNGRNKIINIAEMASNPGSEKPTITSGDKISFFVEPGQNTYIYLYLVDSRGNLELIFPTSLDKNVLKSEFTAGKGTYIPAKYEWFSFDDNRGTETFYLLASSSQLMKLEELTSLYLNAEGDQESTKQMILNEIKGKKKLVAFKNSIEKPISFGGRIRGLEIDIAKLAVEVTGKNIYSKTIRLEHE